MMMVLLNIALHSGIRRPEWHTDEDEIVQATNLWFDAEVSAQDLLDAHEDETYETMNRLLEDCYNEAIRYYRIWDNYYPGEHWEDVTDLEGDFSPENALCYHEWHADVDWDNGKFFSILGSSFSEEMMSEDLISYLKAKVSEG